MKNLLRTLAVMCCLSLVVACGDDPENGDNGDNGDTVSGMFCVETCEEDSDCGDEDDWSCTDNLCEYTGDTDEADPCESDEECVAELSGWEEGECADNSECDAGVCVEHNGEGVCATEETEMMSCEDMMMEAIEAQYFDDADGDEEVTVCGAASAECHDDGFCINPCESDAECADMGVAGWDTCFDDGTCGCGSDDSCDDVDNADTCQDNGMCGCSDDEVCDEDSTCAEVTL